MGQFVAGDVVVLNFPFTDLTQTKRRPALVLAVLPGDDLILCQITSQARHDSFSVTVDAEDFAEGGLSQTSRIRPNRVFTADSNIVVYRAGRLSRATLDEARAQLIRILTA